MTTSAPRKKTLPNPVRGVQAIKWTNALDGSKSTRYRVRIQRKGLKVDKLFLTLAEAKDFLHSTKTKKVAAKLTIDQEVQELIASVFTSNTIRAMFTQDCNAQYAKKKNKTELAERSYKAELSKIKTICDIRISSKQGVKIGHHTLPTHTFKIGDMNHADARAYHFTNFIEKRKAQGRADGTIKREIYMFSGFFTRLIKGQMTTPEFVHPIIGRVDMRDLNETKRVREDITEEGEKLLFELLAKNKRMLAITTLSLLTGMRKSEVLFLTAENVHGNQLRLTAEQTKAKEARTVFLPPEAVKIITDLNIKSGRLFSYTIDGFNKSRRRIFEKAGVAETVDFHSMRRFFITRLLHSDFTQLEQEKFARISESKYFYEKYVKELEVVEEAKTLEQVKKIVGHKDTRQTKRYVVKKA